ncbi:hypothetical protein IO89_11065 [Epilithonimonas lactis]|uniref:Uncharacterized protein n=1 Tax=Epilithonimonas lactis TaxID=421072 RepID=A0A085BE85_9FLAO|nr:hypothetical protein IO89_11065 [Epilithonimonas lactis]
MLIKSSTSSASLSLIVLICVIIINYNILDNYNNSDGKTKAFYDAVVFSKFSFKYYLLIFSIVSLILIRVGFRNNEKILSLRLSIILVIISTVSIFFSFWKLFI